MYAIDNGIKADLIDDDGSKALYIDFLRDLFSLPKDAAHKVLSENMCKSLLSAFSTQIDDCDGNVAEIRKELAPFIADLKSGLGQDAFFNGFQTMDKSLSDTLIPAWSSPEALLLREKISTIYPELTQAITERLALFQEMRKL
jgi:hypothetical protein